MDTVALLGEKRKYEKMKFRPKVGFYAYREKGQIWTNDKRKKDRFDRNFGVLPTVYYTVYS